MKLLFGENFELSIANYFKSVGYDVKHIGSDDQGITDQYVLKLALKEKRILITNDLDFGQLIFQEMRPHNGVILLRLQKRSTKFKIFLLEYVIKKYRKQLLNHFIVIDNRGIRIRK